MTPKLVESPGELYADGGRQSIRGNADVVVSWGLVNNVMARGVAQAVNSVIHKS